MDPGASGPGVHVSCRGRRLARPPAASAAVHEGVPQVRVTRQETRLHLRQETGFHMLVIGELVCSVRREWRRGERWRRGGDGPSGTPVGASCPIASPQLRVAPQPHGQREQ